MAEGTRHLPDEILLRNIDDELSSVRARAEVDAHLALCAICRERRLALVAAAERTEDVLGARSGGAEHLAAVRARLTSGLSRARRANDRVWGRPLRHPFAHVSVLSWSVVVLVAMAVVTWASFRTHVPFALLTSGFRTGAISPGDLPMPALTPGATRVATATELCGAGDVSEGPIPATTRQTVVREYGMERVPPNDYELDYLITPELGGTADPKNLWPERYASPVWNARVKDQLEDLLPTLVCQGRLDLGTAQRDIAVDWIVAYKKYFHTDRPRKIAADAGFATFGFDWRASDAGDIVAIIGPS